MTKYIFSLILILFFMNQDSSHAQDNQIIDRDIFFGNPEISGGQLSPDGKYIAFMKAFQGIMNVWVKKFDEPFEKAKLLTTSQRPLYGFFWTYDSKYILYVKDNDGDENLNIYAVDPAGMAISDGAPGSRNLTPMKEVAAQIYMVSKKNPDILMIGLNDRDKAWHDLYKLSISTGKLEMIYENKDRITGYDFDWDENMRVLSRTDEQGNTDMLRIDGKDKLTTIYQINVKESAYIAGWNKDNSKCYLVTNKGELNLSTAFLMDPVSGKMEKFESDPDNKVDFGGLSFDDNTRDIISTSYEDDKRRIYWKSKTWEKTHADLKAKFPGREVDFQSSTKDYKKLLIAVWGDKYAAEVFYYNVDSKELISQYVPKPKLKAVEGALCEMKAVRYKSSDGMEIPAYLTLPATKNQKNLPVVMLIHGGPKGPRDTWGYDAEAQFLANRGYAVLQPNFRASGGYGKDFLNAGDLQWGKLMQDDITWGVKYLVAQGIADSKKVAIMGGSYGGYATLAGLAFTPELYVCGVDIVGPSNIFTLLESVPAYWESGRAFLYGMVGDPNTEEGKKRIQDASPLFSADKIIKPLLIIQGANDPRVKKAEADQIAIALRDKGKNVSYLLADDEGHGFAKPINRMAMYAEVERFLAEQLGGRYQKEMPDDVKNRLNQLKVDITEVTYSPKAEVKSADVLPAVNLQLSEGAADYNLLLEVQGQSIPMTMKRTITKSGKNWVISDKTSGAMGEMSDVIEYTPQAMPVKRTSEQMGQKMEMTFDGKKISLNAMGKDFPMDMKGAYLCDGPCMDCIIAGFNLKKGYELVFEIPDMTTMKAKQVKLTVGGNESVNGKECTMVEVVSTENDQDKLTLWVNTKTASAEKMVQVIPAMANAKMTITRK